MLSNTANQGCCFSSPAGPNSPYPGGTGSASTRPIINAPPPPSSSQAAVDPEPPPSPSSHRRSSRRPLDQHINKPLRRHEWASKSRTWTRKSLDRERTEFFDTRVTGREEVWQTLQAALEILWEADRAAHGESEVGGSVEQDPAVALATAQSILDAADITLPTGNLGNGAYDSLGNYYQLPSHIVSDPVNTAPSDGDDMADAKADLSGGEETAEEGDVDEDEIERRREEKGKAVIDVRDQVPLVVRLSETSMDLKMHVGKDESVRSIVRKILEETGVSTRFTSVERADH